MRYSLLMVLGAAMALLLFSGCARRTTTGQEQPTQRVAGTEETANTVTVSLTNQNVQVSPASVRYGDVTVSFVNRSNTAKTFTLKGSGGKAITLQPNETFNIAITQQQPNNYTITPIGRGTTTQPGGGAGRGY